MATSDRYSLLLPEDLEAFVSPDRSFASYLPSFPFAMVNIAITDGQRATWAKRLDATPGPLSYERVSDSGDEKEQLRQLQEIMSYPMLIWRIAATHGKHASEVDNEFLQALLDREYADYVAESKRRGVPVTTPEQIEKDAKFTEEFFDHVLKTGTVPQKLGL